MLKRTHLESLVLVCVAGLVTAAAVSVSNVVQEIRARAVSVDMTGQSLNFAYANLSSVSGSVGANNSVVKYSNVGTVSGVSIDAVITTTLTNSTISNFDNPGSAGGAASYFQIDNSATLAEIGRAHV